MPAVYDNPDTECREIYVHGHLVTYYTEAELNRLSGMNYWHISPVQEQFAKYALQYGEFRPGREYDDPQHMPTDPLATEIFLGDTDRKP